MDGCVCYLVVGVRLMELVGSSVVCVGCSDGFCVEDYEL